MPIKWNEPEVKDRLLAAIIASHGCNINCKEVARIFGSDATYDAVENFLRKPKKLAKQMLQNAPAELTASAAKSRAPRTPSKTKPAKTPTSTPKKEGVVSGRVTKTPSKKSSPVKKENLDGDDDFDMFKFESQVSLDDMDAEGEVDEI